MSVRLRQWYLLALVIGILLPMLGSVQNVAAEEDSDTASFGSEASVQEEDEREPSRFRLGVRLGYTFHIEGIFEDSGLDITPNNNFQYGLELDYRLIGGVFFNASVEYYDAPSEADLELTIIPVNLMVRSVFQTKGVQPYIAGGVSINYIDGGEVRDYQTENANVSTDPDSGLLLTEEGDVWFSQQFAFGLNLQLGIEIPVADRVTLFAEANFRGIASSRKFNTYTIPSFVGVRVGL